MLSEATCCHFHSSAVYMWYSALNLIFTGNSAIENLFIILFLFFTQWHTPVNNDAMAHICQSRWFFFSFTLCCPNGTFFLWESQRQHSCYPKSPFYWNIYFQGLKRSWKDWEPCWQATTRSDLRPSAKGSPAWSNVQQRHSVAQDMTSNARGLIDWLIALSPANHNNYLRTDWKTRQNIHTLYTIF